MFGEFNGLPVHVLVVHAVVVLAPLSAAIALAYLVPRWRHVLRWPLMVTAVAAAGAAFVAKESGKHLQGVLEPQLEGTPVGALVDEHEELGGKLFIALLVFAVLAVAVAAPARIESLAVAWTGAIALAVMAVVVGVLTFQTGEKGSEAVWNPTGNVDYSDD